MVCSEPLACPCRQYGLLHPRPSLDRAVCAGDWSPWLTSLLPCANRFVACFLCGTLSLVTSAFARHHPQNSILTQDAHTPVLLAVGRAPRHKCSLTLFWEIVSSATAVYIQGGWTQKFQTLVPDKDLDVNTGSQAGRTELTATTLKSRQ